MSLDTTGRHGLGRVGPSRNGPSSIAVRSKEKSAFQDKNTTQKSNGFSMQQEAMGNEVNQFNDASRAGRHCFAP